MKATKSVRTRHFPYKSPRFGSKNKPAPKSAWENTVYYWWWAYLKRNADYLSCCESGGAGKLASLYADFGDVRGDDFKAWWTFKVNGEDRGAYLFAEPSVESSVKVLKEGEKAASEAEVLTVSLPLSFPKRFLERRFKAILSEAHKGKRGIQLARTSKATYRFKGQPNIPALKQGLMVYDALKAVEGLKPKKPQWEIAQELKLVEAKMRVRKTDTPAEAADKKNVLTAIVGRYKKRVAEVIQLTASGSFPTPITERKSKIVEFGYDVIDGVKVPNVTQQRLIVEMKEMRSKGQSLRSIHKWLNSEKRVKLNYPSMRKSLD